MVAENEEVESPQSKLWRAVFVEHLKVDRTMRESADAANKAVTLYSASFCFSTPAKELEEEIEALRDTYEDMQASSSDLLLVEGIIERLEGLVARWRET